MQRNALVKLSPFGALGAALLAAAALALSPADTQAANPSPAPEATYAPAAAPTTHPAPASLVPGQPISFADCVAPGTDCCNPTCKAAITACCIENSCGLPVTGTVEGKGPFAGLTMRCADIAPYIMLEDAPATP